MITPEDTEVDVPPAFVAVANAPYFAPTVFSIVAVTESAPAEDATSSLDKVGLFPVLEILISTA